MFGRLRHSLKKRMKPMTIDPTLHFLAACSYIPAGPDGFARQKRQLEAGLRVRQSPEGLWAGIQRHRIFASAERVLREHGLQHVLGDFAARLQRRAGEVRQLNFRQVSASMGISSALSSAGIAYHFFKGPMLSQRIYGDVSLRHSKDLDLAVKPEQIASAVDVLRAGGWKLRNAEMWLRGGMYRLFTELRLRHLDFFHEEKKVSLELHWRIEQARSRDLDAKWWSYWAEERSGLTHADSLHLCLHGAIHGWSRLKWLGDLAAIVERQPEFWHASEATSAALGLELASAQTIVLLQLLFDMEPDEHAARIVKKEPRAGALAEYAVAEMSAPDIYRKRSVNEGWAQRRYLSNFETRYSLLDRLAYRLGFWLFEDNQALYRHPLLLLGMPIARAAGLFNRHVLLGER
jgi:hypothetical protein